MDESVSETERPMKNFKHVYVIIQALFGKDSNVSLSNIVLYGNRKSTDHGNDGRSNLKDYLTPCTLLSPMYQFEINERFPLAEYDWGLDERVMSRSNFSHIETIIVATAVLLSNEFDTIPDRNNNTQAIDFTTSTVDMEYSLSITHDLMMIGSQPSKLSTKSNFEVSSSELNDSHLHNIVCTNGQPQLMDIFPLVYRKLPSLNIIVVSLIEDLDDKPDAFSCEREPCFTNRELIIKVCQIVSRQHSNHDKHKLGILPHVMIVATDLDKVPDPEDRVRKFNHSLENVTGEFGHVLLRKSKKEIIFSLPSKSNNYDDWDKELLTLIYTHLKSVYAHATIPLKWLIYSHIILKVNGVLTMKDCVRIGEMFNNWMESTEISDALNFLAKDMGIIVADFSNDIILTNLHLLIKHLSSLVHEYPNMLQNRKYAKLIEKGLFNITYINAVLRGMRGLEEKISNEEFLKICEFLKIIVPVNVGGEREFFFPGALSYKPAEQPDSFLPSRASSMLPVDPPLIFSWGEYFLPDGFFFTVIIELLRRGGNSDGGYMLKPCTDVQQWREEIQLSLKDVGGKEVAVIKLINRFKSIWIEVSSTITADEICPVFLKKVHTAIEETRHTDTIKHFNIDSPEVATPCSLCQGCTVDHVACFSPDRAKITCTLDSDKIGDAIKETNYWFKDNNRTEVSDIKKSKPKLKEVFKLLRCKSTAWLDIGRELDLDYCDREQILKNIQKPKDEDKLEDVLYKWIESECSEVSWDNLYKVLKELKLNDVAQELQQNFLTATS